MGREARSVSIPGSIQGPEDAAGIAYGIVVYFVMTFVVVPLSRAKSGHVTMTSFAENLAAMILFGLIVSYIARRTTAKGVSAKAAA